MHRIQFCLHNHYHTHYHGKHNHKGTVPHRFLVQLSYARQSTAKTPLSPMKQLADLVHYAQAYKIEHNYYSQGQSTTNDEVSKIVLYVPLSHCKRVQQLLYELRYTIGIVTLGQRHGQKGYVFFNTSEVQDYLAE